MGEACRDAVITGSNIKSIDADKAGSMRNAQVTLSSVVADFDLNCIGIGSCEGMKLEINIEGPPPGFMCNPQYSGNLIEWASLSCYGQDSCRNMEIIVNNCDLIGTSAGIASGLAQVCGLGGGYMPNA